MFTKAIQLKYLAQVKYNDSAPTWESNQQPQSQAEFPKDPLMLGKALPLSLTIINQLC